MRDRAITFDLLNAYVDGELDAAEAAEVARAVADDPALAHEVAALSRLRLVVTQSMETPDIALPQPRRRRRTLPAAAAAAAFLLFLGGAALLSGMDTAGTQAAWLADAWRAHRAWPAEQERTRPFVPARHAGALAEAYVPDLSASRLTLIHSEVRPLGDGAQALLTGYRGSRGCKVSLLVFPSQGGLIAALRPFRREGQEAYGWQVGGLDYLLLSDGMESRRFALLAETVQAGSRRHAPFDAETRTALRQSRDRSAPCNA
ncbi:MAG: hypothetical protein CMM77_12385 [Rhodospirillaceae bacterium]|nr:hypothetical protein [Magnetovibrio sp.]MAY67912.1 hypothetical protein [Rhodospirillaceae bacterium]|tara:strand:+ start:30 stop:809 length:780 start_codon:yes stop_codon:yes gene_type:complete